jgi:hypothetical protein
MDAIYVHVATVRTGNGDSRDVTAWSAGDKARGYVADQVPVPVEWTGGESDDRATAETPSGELIGIVDRVEVMDPASLSQQYPDSMPNTRFITADEPGESSEV